MKKVIAMLALVALVGNVANAELLKDFKYDGKIIVNGYATSNDQDEDSDAADKTSDVDSFVILNAGFNLTDDVDAVVSAVKCNQQYGRVAGESVAAGTADGFFMEQAYLNLKGVLGIDHKIGRQYYGEEGDLIVRYGTSMSNFDTTAGVLAVNQFTGAIGVDGWTGWYAKDKLTIHAITAKNAANSVANPNTDQDLVGVVGGYDLMEPLKISAFIYEQKNYQDAANVAGAKTADKMLDIVGVKGTGKFMGFDYYGILAKNYGHDHNNDQNYTGTGFLAGAKYDIELVGKWIFMGEMARGSGDKTSVSKNEQFMEIASDYRPSLIWNGVKGNAGIGNLTAWNLGAMWNTPMFEKLTLGGKLYHFGMTEKVASAGAGSTALPQETDTIGNELDLCAMWKHNENVTLKAYYAAFMPDSKYAKYAADEATAKDDMTTLVGAALSVKF
ncbi:MAG: alginate export family protein [Elusimicrobiales bacterium]|nr:alginate export family protein [Elusimicrobiales bacterium]